MVSQRIRARFEDGVLKPLERLQLRDQEEVTVSIESSHGEAKPSAWFFPQPGWGRQRDGSDLIEMLYRARAEGSREPPSP